MLVPYDAHGHAPPGRHCVPISVQDRRRVHAEFPQQGRGLLGRLPGLPLHLWNVPRSRVGGPGFFGPPHRGVAVPPPPPSSTRALPNMPLSDLRYTAASAAAPMTPSATVGSPSKKVYEFSVNHSR